MTDNKPAQCIGATAFIEAGQGGAMTCEEAIKELESLGTEQNRKIYRRHGAGAALYSVSFANLGRLKKRD